MLPQDTLSTVPVPGRIMGVNAFTINTPLHSRCMGAGNIQVPDLGLEYQMWECMVVNDDIEIWSATNPPVVWFTLSGITRAQLAFDANMYPHILIEHEAKTKIILYDSNIGAPAVKDLGEFYIDSLLRLDDRRQPFFNVADIILSYLKTDGALYYRQQRDLYDIERKLADGPFTRHTRAGMNDGYRFQFEVRAEVNDYVD